MKVRLHSLKAKLDIVKIQYSLLIFEIKSNKIYDDVLTQMSSIK